MVRALYIIVAALMGIAATLNGLFMLISPQGWYFAVPGVTTTGPFNQHFIRDIGLVYLAMGASFLIGAAKVQFRILLWAAPTIWLAAHAFFHLWEVSVSISPHSAMARDFPAVTLPAIIGLALTLWAYGRLSEASILGIGRDAPLAPRHREIG